MLIQVALIYKRLLLGYAPAGWSMNLPNLAGSKVEYKAGSDIRFHIQDLTSAYIRVKDVSGYWEARVAAVREPSI
jgi:hypothetical protein